MKILAEISTKDRYFTTLPMAIQSIAMQYRKPDHLIIFDDGEHKDLREDWMYKNIFSMLSSQGISWEVMFTPGDGQHHNHERANTKEGFDAVWRVDDDLICSPDTLMKLEAALIENNATAVGPRILSSQPIHRADINEDFGSIENIHWAPNVQWYIADENDPIIRTDHLHCSFLYLTGVANYDTTLSPVAHREETMFSCELTKGSGKKCLVIPVNNYHYRNPNGGIRSHGHKFFYSHDESKFLEWAKVNEISFATSRQVCLDCGIGDHWAFKHILEEMLDKFDVVPIYCCFPDTFKDLKEKYGNRLPLFSIAEAGMMGIDPRENNVYAFMIKTGFQGNLAKAFRKQHLGE